MVNRTDRIRVVNAGLIPRMRRACGPGTVPSWPI